MLYIFQIGKEHVGLKAVTEILQDIQYKVSHYLIKVNKNTGCVRCPQDHSQAWWVAERTHCYSHGCGLLQGRDMEHKSAHEKGQGAKPRRNQLQASRCPSWWTGLACICFSQWWYVTTCVKCYQPGKLPEPWCAGTSWGLSYGSMKCLGDWATLIPALTPTLSKTSIHLNHIVIRCVPTGTAGPKASGVQKHSYQADYSMSSEMNSQYFFWATQASTEFFYPLTIGKLCK